ncbi:MAG: hypothetical protein NTW60_03650 [Candidatus Wolfebacteria bacterium]|nr:hypothetical protein [Candidatus Wolfebacteria bacterium]
MTITKLNLILALIFLGIIILVIPTPVFPGDRTNINQSSEKALSLSSQEIRKMWIDAYEKISDEVAEDPTVDKCDVFLVLYRRNRQGTLLVETRCAIAVREYLQIPKPQKF